MQGQRKSIRSNQNRQSARNITGRSFNAFKEAFNAEDVIDQTSNSGLRRRATFRGAIGVTGDGGQESGSDDGFSGSVHNIMSRADSSEHNYSNANQSQCNDRGFAKRRFGKTTNKYSENYQLVSERIIQQAEDLEAMVSGIEGQIEASNIQDRAKEQINEVLETVKQLFQNEIIQEITETAFDKHRLQEATEQLSKHELRILELEEEL